MKRVITDVYLTNLGKELFKVLEDTIIFIDFGNIDKERATELRDALTDWLGDTPNVATNQAIFNRFISSSKGRQLLLEALDSGVLGSDKVWYIDADNELGYHNELPNPPAPVDF